MAKNWEIAGLGVIVPAVVYLLTIPHAAATTFVIISLSGTNVTVKDVDGTVLYSGPSVSVAYSRAIGSKVNPTVRTKLGIYNLDAMITALNAAGVNIDGVTLDFEPDAVLFVSNGMNNPAILLISCNNWLILNPAIDGNAVNQGVSAVYGNNGIDFEYSTNCRVDGAHIINCGQFGFFAWDSCFNVGIMNSKLLNCGWNGITLGGGVDCYDLFAINNEVAYCSDVGITSYGYNTKIKKNFIHDMNGTRGSGGVGVAGSQWGIGVEAGGGNIITENTIADCLVGIVVDVSNQTPGEGHANTISKNKIIRAISNGLHLKNSDYNIVNENDIIDWDTQDTWKNAISINGGNYNKLFGNKLTSTHPYATGIVIGEAGGGTGNQIGDITQLPNIITLANIGNNSAIVVCAGAIGTIIENNKIIGGAGPAGIHVRAGAIGTIIRHNDLSQCTNDQKILDEGTGTIIEPNNVGYP